MYELREYSEQWATRAEYDVFRNRSEPLVKAQSPAEAILLGVLLDVLPVYASLLRAYDPPRLTNPPGGNGAYSAYRFRPGTQWLIVRDMWWASSGSAYLGVELKDTEILLGPSLRRVGEDVIQYYYPGRFCIAGAIPRKELAEYIAWHLSVKNYPRSLG